MNQSQGIILFLGLVLIVILCLRPPFQWEHSTFFINRDSSVPHRAMVSTENIGHCWIWSPPKGWEESLSYSERRSHVAAIDWPRLGVYVGLTALVTMFAAFVVFGDRKGRAKANG